MLYTNTWYVAESSKTLGDEPIRLQILGRNFVLFRDAGGKAACLSDVCPHRGASLARGKCHSDGTVSCPFHGWHFDGEGRCVEIPSQERPGEDIPARAQVDAYPVEERYGLIWVFLGDDPASAAPIPQIPEYDSSEWRCQHYAETWNANLHWSKMTDMDHVHLAIVHGIDFGGDNPTRPPAHEIENTEFGFRTEIRGHTPPSARSFKEYKGERSGAVSKLSFSVAGFMLRGEVAFAGEAAGMTNLFFEFSTPVNEEQTRMFYIFCRNFFMEPKHDGMHLERNLKNVFQDKANAESIMPKYAPDVDHWPPVRADREDLFMAAYWRQLRALRNKGWQIDRLELVRLDRDGDYRVIASPGRRANPEHWVHDVVPLLPIRDEREGQSPVSLEVAS